jgi:hypothetical protein
MGQRIDQFCDDLRRKLTSIDNNMDSLKTEIDNRSQNAEQEVQKSLDAVKKRIELGAAKLVTAQAEVKRWAEERKTATDKKIVEWKTKREAAKLQDRADSAERYAAAVAIVASAALEEVQQAALEAWLARKDAEKAQDTKAA